MHCQFNFHTVKKKKNNNKNTKRVKQIQKLGFSIKSLLGLLVSTQRNAPAMAI